MVAYKDEIFPLNPDEGADFGLQYKPFILEMDSGQDYVVDRWGDAGRYVYNAGSGVRDKTDLVTLYEFYIAMKGPTHAFPFKDWFDYASTDTHVTFDGSTVDDEDEVLGTGDNSTTTFQLIKRYIVGSTVRTRTIDKPKAGTVTVALDGVNQASGWSVNTQTGVITFTTAPNPGVVVSAGFEFYVPCRFAEDIDFRVQLQLLQSGITPTIPLIHEPETSAFDEEYPYGGSQLITLSANTQVSFINGRMISVQCETGSLELQLPDESTIPRGIGHAIVHSLSTSTQNFTLTYDDGTSIVTMTPGDTKQISLGLNNSSARTWFAS